MVLPLAAAGMAAQGVGAVSGMIGGGRAASARAGVLARIQEANTQFANDRFDRSQTLADDMFGLGTTDNLNRQAFFERQASMERENAGAQGSESVQASGMSAVGDVMAGIPGLAAQSGPMDPAALGLQRAINFEGQQEQGMNMDLLGMQGMQQGQHAFDLGSVAQFGTQGAQLGREGQIFQQDSSTMQNIANLDHELLMGRLNAQLGAAGKEGQGLRAFGALSQLAGAGMTSAGAFSLPKETKTKDP